VSAANPRLAPCAWLVDCGHGRRVVHRGAWTTLQGRMVAEGAWAGDLSAEGALTSPFRSGSGAVFGDDRLTLFAPSHSVESIYCFVPGDGGGVVASNSLAMIAGYRDDAMYARGQAGPIHRRANAIVNGWVEYPRELYRTATGTMHRLAWGVFDIDPYVGAVHERPPFPPGPAPFTDFGSYRDYLRHVIAATMANARDGQRARPFDRLVSSVSAGYDSPALAALAASVGGTQTITLTTSRGGEPDSGRPVADALGMDCVEVERTASRIEDDRTSFVDAADLGGSDQDLFVASTFSAGDLIYRPFAPTIRGSVLLVGHIGDAVWSAGCKSGPEVRRLDNAGAGFDEFRRHVGFVQLPAPFIGAQHSEVIEAITASDEMRPYSVESTYDRPIPRRIAEEAGVPRSAFGQHKRAAVAQVRIDHGAQHAALSRLARRYRAAMDGAEDLQPPAAAAGAG